MTGGEDMTTSTDLSVKVIDELTGVRGDIREIMTTLRHFDSKLDRVNDDVKEIKVLANEAGTKAEAADVKAQKAIDATANQKDDITDLYNKIEKSEEKQRSQGRYLVTTIIALVGVIIAVVNMFII